MVTLTKMPQTKFLQKSEPTFYAVGQILIAVKGQNRGKLSSRLVTLPPTYILNVP